MVCVLLSYCLLRKLLNFRFEICEQRLKGLMVFGMFVTFLFLLRVEACELY
jgi:hypothetical protein